MRREVIIDRRFNGPPDTANGGYACGIVSGVIDGAAEAVLKLPPPLDTPMILEDDGLTSRLLLGDELVAEAHPTSLDVQPPAVPALEQARAASSRYVGFDNHQFPTCYVCGPARTDGLGVFPGAIPELEVVATAWTPDETIADSSGDVDRKHVWATLDCPSYFAIPATPPALLAGLMTEILRLPRIGEDIVAFAWWRSSEGRKHLSGSALASSEGEVIAVGSAVWIEPKGGLPV